MRDNFLFKCTHANQSVGSLTLAFLEEKQMVKLHFSLGTEIYK